MDKEVKPMLPLDDYIKSQLNDHIAKIGNQLESDTISIVSPIIPGIDVRVRDAVEMNNTKTSWR